MRGERVILCEYSVDPQVCPASERRREIEGLKIGLVQGYFEVDRTNIV